MALAGPASISVHRDPPPKAWSLLGCTEVGSHHTVTKASNLHHLGHFSSSSGRGGQELDS